MLNKRSGISLIVLVITIIVMIILATVIILSLDSSNIIERANEAKEATNLANLKEAANVALAEYKLEVSLGNINSSEISANDYVKDKLEEQGIDASTMVVTEEGKILTGLTEVAVKFIEAGVEIGATVTGYTLSTATSAKNVNTDGTENTGDPDNYVETDPQPANITRDENITWSYMGIDENGEALIVGNVTSRTPTLALGGKGGYLKGVNALNTICKTMYTSDMGTARNINVDDVNDLLGTNPVGGYYNAEYNFIENHENLTVGELISEKGEPGLYFTATVDENSLESYEPNRYEIAKSTVTASDTIKSLVYQSTTYWLSSTYVSYGALSGGFSGDMGYVDFGMRCVTNSKVSDFTTFTSETASNSLAYAIRPIVKLTADVDITVDSDGSVTLSK